MYAERSGSNRALTFNRSLPRESVKLRFGRKIRTNSAIELFEHLEALEFEIRMKLINHTIDSIGSFVFPSHSALCSVYRYSRGNKLSQLQLKRVTVSGSRDWFDRCERFESSKFEPRELLDDREVPRVERNQFFIWRSSTGIFVDFAARMKTGRHERSRNNRGGSSVAVRR